MFVVTEKWRDIEGFEEFYQVSDLGNIRSLTRTIFSQGKPPRTLKNQVIKTFAVYKGYRQVKLRKNGKNQRFLVSRLVLTTFDRPPLDGEVACHCNGNHTDNRLANLRWDTAKGNEADKVIHGTTNHGEKNGQCRLSALDVMSIRADLAQGMKGSALARKYGVQQTTISAIKTRRSWKHI